MIPAPGFFLHHGNDLPMLAAVLGERLTDPDHSDWWQADTVLIPQPSMRRWLQNSLAGQLGIAANLDFRLPGQLLDSVLRAWLPAHDSSRLLNAEHLRWRVFALLTDDMVMETPALSLIQGFLDGGDRQLRAWQLAGELSQSFEKYQAWRREWLLAWQQKPNHDDWQSVLWHLASQGRVFRAQAVEAYLDSLVHPDCPRPTGLPDRLFVFACQNLSPDVLRIVQSFGRWIRVEFFLHNPCEAYWGDSGQQRTGAEILSADFDNPLLQRWGYAGRDFIASLLSEQSTEWLGEAEHYLNPADCKNPSLLQHLQDDVLNRTAPVPGSLSNAALLADNSIQIHCCAGPLREVQMLRAQLLAILRRHPDLQWRDIAVMAPDLERYAPFFAPVFGQHDADYPALPFALSETATDSAGGLHELFFRLLKLAHSRFTGNDGLQLLGHPLLAARYRLSGEDLQRASAWLAQAGVRWGLDAEHREQIDGVAQFTFSWRFALQRLLYGYASTDPMIGGTAPVALPSGKDQHLLDALFLFIDRIECLRAQLAETHSAGEWQGIAQELLAWLTADRALTDADAGFLEQCQNLLATLPVLADNAGLAAAFNSEVLALWLSEAMQAPLGQAWLSGRVTVCKMVPMRLIPFKVICLLGMDEAAFPRQEAMAAINRLAGKTAMPRLGDRNTRNDDRYLMLQLLSSCQSHWIISYSGLNAIDGSERPPAIVVQDLLQVIVAYASADAATAKALIIRHPIHAFENAADDRIAVLHGIAGTRPDPGAAPLFAGIAVTADEALPAPFLDISLPEFIGFWQHPLETLAKRQSIRFRLHDGMIEESEPLGIVAGLDKYRLVEAMVSEALDNPQPNPEALLQRLQAEGALAPGYAGKLSFHSLYAGIASALQALSDARMPPLAFDLEYRHSGARLHGHLLQRFRPGIMVLALNKDKLQPKKILAAGLSALLAQANGLSVAVGTQTGKGFEKVAFSYSAQQAGRYLEMLLEYCRQGHSGILCFDPDASFAWYAAKRKNPAADVGTWLEQQLAKEDQRTENREPGLIDVLTEGAGFLSAVACRQPEAFDRLAMSVCGILSGDPP